MQIAAETGESRMGYRKQRLKAELGSFLRLYGRKADRNHDPNDRHYSRRLERQIKRMPPEELDAIMRGEDEDDETGKGQ